MNLRTISLIILLFTVIITNAQDRVFTHTYQTNVLPSGALELEYWSTVKSGRNDFYNAIDQRIELELGLGKNVQTAFYLNFNTKSALVKEYAVDSTGKSYLSGSHIQSETELGFSNEWKLRISDPVANKIGFGLYGEVGFNGSELELEAKVLLDKRINKNLFALNLVGEYEVEYEAEGDKVEAEAEYPFEFDAAYMRLIGNHAGVGFEVNNRNLSSKDKGWEFSVINAGPTFHFNGDRWFINVSLMPQLTNLKKEKGADNLELKENERMKARILLSFAF